MENTPTLTIELIDKIGTYIKVSGRTDFYIMFLLLSRHNLDIQTIRLLKIEKVEKVNDKYHFHINELGEQTYILPSECTPILDSLINNRSSDHYLFETKKGNPYPLSYFSDYLRKVGTELNLEGLTTSRLKAFRYYDEPPIYSFADTVYTTDRSGNVVAYQNYLADPDGSFYQFSEEHYIIRNSSPFDQLSILNQTYSRLMAHFYHLSKKAPKHATKQIYDVNKHLNIIFDEICTDEPPEE